MFFISSALASQTASKTTAWDSLVMLGQRLGDITKQHADHMTIDHWWVGLRVRIKPFWEIGRNVISATYHKGISTIISWKQIAARIMEKAEDKSLDLEVIREGNIFIKVQGSQATSGYWTVKAFPQGLTCNCWHFRCLHNRMVRGFDGIKEAQTLLEAIKNYRTPSGLQPALKERADLDSSGHVKIISECQIQCHHIRAAMRECFEAFTVGEYLFNYRKKQADWMNTKLSAA